MILMHSGIGPAEQLRQHDIGVIVDSPDVGENLHDHPMVPVRAYVKGELGYQAAAMGLGTVKAGLRYLATKDGPAAGSGIEKVSHWTPSDFTADPAIQCFHAPIIATDASPDRRPLGNQLRARRASAEVVDARLRVRGIDGLRVIDASIMPNITSGNTNAPSQAQARNATAMLVEDLKRN